MSGESENDIIVPEHLKLLLNQVVGVSTLLPIVNNDDYEECAIYRDCMEDLSKYRGAFNFALQKSELRVYLIRLIQHLIDKTIPFSAPNNVYFKILGLSTQEHVHFFNLLFTHYESTFREGIENHKYREEFESKFKHNTSQLGCSIFIIEELQSFVKHKLERIQIYQYFLEVNYSDMSREYLNTTLLDLIRLKEYDLFKAYITTFNQSPHLKNCRNSMKVTVLDEACSAYSLDIVQYLIETVGIDYHYSKSIYGGFSIVRAVVVNGDYNLHKKDYDHHIQFHHRYNDEELEVRKQQSLKIVQYLFELYKRDNRIDEINALRSNRNYITNPNDIVKIAYKNANIPVLLFLKQNGFNISERNIYLLAAIPHVGSVKLFINEYQSHSPPENSLIEAIQIKPIVYEATMIESLEILDILGEFGFTYAYFAEEFLGSARIELLSYIDLYKYLDEFYYGDTYCSSDAQIIVFKIMISKFFNIGYLDALFTKYPFFKSYFCYNQLSLTSLLENFEECSNIEKITVVKNFITTSEAYPFVCKYTSFIWGSTFVNLASCNSKQVRTIDLYN